MTTNNSRVHKRLAKPLTIQFCLADALPKKWDMSSIDNISLGGVKFNASGHLFLVGQNIQLRIRFPELGPQCLEVEAIILDNTNAYIRAKFINLTEKNKEHLSVLEKLIIAQEGKRKF